MTKMMRRRFLAALGAVGLGTQAQKAFADDCMVRDLNGSYDNPKPVYSITATNAQFAVPADIDAISPENAKITLVAPAEKGGTGPHSTALIKGQLTRASAEDSPTIKIVSFEWPVTVLDTDGKYNTIVGLAYDQNVPVGFQITSGENALGSVELKQAGYPHDSTSYAFTDEAAHKLHAALMTGEPFTMELMVAGVVYSRIVLGPDAYSSFVTGTALPEMDRIAKLDADGGCEAPSYDNNYDSNYGGGYGVPCFLTTACCSVVGLADDCWELAMLRRLRDTWMVRFAEGRADIDRYERNAPEIAARLGATRQGRIALLRLYWSVIVPAALMIRLGLRRAPYRLYRTMMVRLGA